MAIYKQSTREKYATVAGDKFPIGDASHAKAALARLNQAKPPLTASQKAKVRAKAHKFLGKGGGGYSPAAIGHAMRARGM